MDDSPLLTLPEVARILRVNRDTVYRLARDGAIPVARFGKSLRVPRAALMEHIERQAREAVKA